LLVRSTPNLKGKFLKVRPDTQDEEIFGSRTVCGIIGK